MHRPCPVRSMIPQRQQGQGSQTLRQRACSRPGSAGPLHQAPLLGRQALTASWTPPVLPQRSCLMVRKGDAKVAVNYYVNIMQNQYAAEINGHMVDMRREDKKQISGDLCSTRHNTVATY